MTSYHSVALIMIVFAHVQGDKVWPGEEEIILDKGENTVLNCDAVVTLGNGIKWKRNHRTIYQTWPPDWKDHREYDQDKYTPWMKSEKEYRLTIHHVDQEDADVYTCELIHRSNDTSHLYRIYVSYSKELNLPWPLEEGKDYRGLCRIGYFHPVGAAGYFEMTISVEGKNLHMFDNKTSCDGSTNTCIVSKKFAVRGNMRDQGRSLQCVLKSVSMNLTYSMNMRIRYPATKVHISPMKSSFKVGEMLTCSADGYPPGEFIWKSASVPRVIIGDHLFILWNMTGKQSWECSSMNYPRAEPRQIEFNIEKVKEKEVLLHDDSPYVAATFILMVLLLASIAAFIFIWFKYKSIKSSLSWSTQVKDVRSHESPEEIPLLEDTNDVIDRVIGEHPSLMKAPQCIIKWEENDKLAPVKEVLVQLRELQGPVVVVAIAGMLRTGKSYLMNRIAQQTDGFTLGSTVEAKTKGIWIWVKPHPRKEGTNLVLLDTEGLGDPKQPKGNRDSWIFTLATLLSSTLIHNVLGTITDDIITRLEFISELTRRIKISSSEDTDQDNDFDMYFPQFVVTVRDFSLVLKSDGNDISSDDYLEQALELRKGKEEHNQRRIRLRTYYKKRKCFIFDKPATRNDLKKLATLGEEYLSADFKEDMKKFCDFVYDECEPLILPDGQLMDGAALATLIEYYTKAATEYKEICVGSAMEVVKVGNKKEALSGGLRTYKDIMENELKMPTPDEETFDECHYRALEAAQKYFVEKDQIYKQRNQYQIKNRELSKKCGDMLKRHRKKIHEAMRRTNYRMKELEDDLKITCDELECSGIKENQAFKTFEARMKQNLVDWHSAEVAHHEELQDLWLPLIEPEQPVRKESIDKEKEKSCNALVGRLEEKMIENSNRWAEHFTSMQEVREAEEQRLRNEGLTNQADILREKIEADTKKFDETRKANEYRLSRIKKIH